MGEARCADGRQRTRLLRLPIALGVGLILTGAGDPARTSAIVSPAAEQTLRGWGMSLAWEANVIYGGPFDAAQVPDPAEQGRYMDLLFGDPARGPGLGLNVARYNIGGSDNPDPGRCPAPPAAQRKGFSPGRARSTTGPATPASGICCVRRRREGRRCSRPSPTRPLGG